ncbi:uncharacterized protein LOC132750594 isoform X2 [Ruditapes philippinarum]|uniref:uncharacterized protein LOC132750594 isoform X2 n=1 Tax=Ruditapes philippinarum TaxID=129788 RepID=UPI00295AD63A|nr:uncharacterized protein LOC132750594 isoform X2 [Ruditapes philippinarum]
MERLTSSSDYTSLTMEVTGRTSRENDISYKDSERTNVTFNCDPCENEGDEQPAEGFCENCQEYLCSSCFKIHRRPALWRHHVLLDKENMPSSKTTKEQLNYECTEPCSEHSTKLLEYFCQTHSQLGCPVCITTKHRMCNDVDYIPDIAGHFRESAEVKETFKTLQSLKEDINTYSATLSVDKMKVKTYEKNAKEHILQLRDEFESICNRLVENVEHVRSSDESNIQGYLEACEDILNKIKIRQSVLEKKQADMNVSQVFTEAKLSKLSAIDCRREFETIRECTKSRHYEIKFDIEALREMMKLTFRDQINENAKDSSECEYPQTNTVRGQYHDVNSKTDNEEGNVFGSGVAWKQSISMVNSKTDYKGGNIFKSGGAWGQSKYQVNSKTDNEEKKVFGSGGGWGVPISMVNSKTDNEEKKVFGSGGGWGVPISMVNSKTDYKEGNVFKSGGAWGQSISMLDSDVGYKEEKRNKKSGKVWEQSGNVTERTPQKQEHRGYGNKGLAYCEDSTFELDSEVSYKAEKGNKKSGKVWEQSGNVTERTPQKQEHRGYGKERVAYCEDSKYEVVFFKTM